MSIGLDHVQAALKDLFAHRVVHVFIEQDVGVLLVVCVLSALQLKLD